MTCPNRCLLKGIGFAFALLVLLCLFGVLNGCASGEKVDKNMRMGCIHYLDKGNSTYERVQIVEETETGDYLVIHVDSTDRSPTATARNTVQFLGCPGMQGITGRQDIFDASVRGVPNEPTLR